MLLRTNDRSLQTSPTGLPRDSGEACLGGLVGHTRTKLRVEVMVWPGSRVSA